MPHDRQADRRQRRAFRDALFVDRTGVMRTVCAHTWRDTIAGYLVLIESHSSPIPPTIEARSQASAPSHAIT